MTKSEDINKSARRPVCARGLDADTTRWIAEHGVEPVVSLEPRCPVRVYNQDFKAWLIEDFEIARQSDSRAILCLQEAVTDSYLELLNLNVRHITYMNSPFADEAFLLAVQDVRDLKQILRIDGGLIGMPGIETASLKEKIELQFSGNFDVVPQVQDLLERHDFPGHFLGDACIATKEAVTNALFHSFRETDSPTRKYNPDTFTGLRDDDRIDLEFYALPGLSVLKVTDNAGALGPLSVANSLDRHRSERGLYDHRGRGFHLMRHMAHRVVIALDRLRSTSVELYFQHDINGDFERHFEMVDF